MSDTSKNLYQRISAVMQNIQYLQKDDTVGGGNYGYKAISIEKVMEVVRASMIEHGLVILPVAQQHSLVDYERPGKQGNSIVSLTTVDVQYKIVNTDNPAEFELLGSSGTGVDPQDKGVGKAMTYAHKNLALRLFMIPTGDDADKVHNSELERQQQKAAQQAAEAREVKLKEAVAAMEAAADMNTLKALWTQHKEYQNTPSFQQAKDNAKARLEAVTA